MTRVLITGAAGFVGANLAARCTSDGCEVSALVRPGSDRWRLEPIAPHVRIIEVDLHDAEAVRRAVAAARPEWILHTAAYGAYSWQTDPERIVQTNVGGLANLLEASAAAGVEAFVQSGTSSEYGHLDRPASEADPCRPRSRYAASKLCATEYGRFFARAGAVPVTTLRLYSVYGPFEEPHRLMPMLVVRGLDGELPALADPRAAHDFVYVDDVCEAFVRVARQRPDHDILNVGTGVQTTLAEAVALAQSRLPIAAAPVWQSMPAREWDTAVWVADTRRAASAGWRAASTLADGFERLVRWIDTTPGMRHFYRQRQRMPPAGPGTDRR